MCQHGHCHRVRCKRCHRPPPPPTTLPLLPYISPGLCLPPPSSPSLPAGRRALQASYMELGATSPAGLAAVWVRHPTYPGPSPSGCAHSRRGWGVSGVPQPPLPSPLPPRGLDFQIRLRDFVLVLGLGIQRGGLLGSFQNPSTPPSPLSCDPWGKNWA